MSTLTTHEYAQELLAAEALDALEPGERDRILTHLQDCPVCSHAFREYRETAALLAHAAPVRAMDRQRSDRLRARLLDQARADRAGEIPAVEASPTPVTAMSRHRPGDWGRWAGWGVAAGLSSLLLTHHAFHRPLSLGWVAAAMFGVLLVGVGVYAVIQRDRVLRTQRELEELKARHNDARRDPAGHRL